MQYYSLKEGEMEDVYIVTWHLCRTYMRNAYTAGCIVKDAYEKFGKYHSQEYTLPHRESESKVFFKHMQLSYEDASLWHTLHVIPKNME